MPFADQVPINNPHSTMLGSKWVVLIAGSTGSALRAVRPPNFHITPMSTRSQSRCKRDRFSIAFAPGHHGPSYSGDLVGERERGNLGRPPRQQCGEPRSVSDTVDLGITNDCECTRCEQAT